jgi:hypothetical protein
MIENVAVEAQVTKPAISQIKVDLFAQPPLGADAETIADDQHPDHQHWINRRPSDLTVVGFKMRA